MRLSASNRGTIASPPAPSPSLSSLFPELEAEVLPESGFQAATVPIGKAPEGKTLICGEHGIRTFTRLFDLPGPVDPSTRIAGVEVPLETGHIRVRIEGDALGSPVLVVTPCWPTKTQPRDFFVGLEGSEPSEPVKALLIHLTEHLGPARYTTVLKGALRDPDRSVHTAPEAPEPEEDPFALSVVKTWSSDRAWREFFADQEQQRNFHHRLRGEIVILEHGDLECHFATQPVGDGTMGFFNYSSIHVQPHAMTGRGEASEEEPGYIITDVLERDIIQGGIPKFDAALESVAVRANKPDLVIARGTCPTIVVGDDMRGAVSRFQERTGIRTVFLDHLEDRDTDPFQAVFESLRADWTAVEPERQRGRVNLIGFPMDPLIDDLRGMVRSLGLTVNANLVPDVDLHELMRFSEAELSVFFDSSLYDATYRRLLGDALVPELRPPAPFGPTACRAWIGAIAEATGRSSIADAVWDLHWGPLAAQFEALVAQVEGYRMGFVVDARRLAVLQRPEQRTGTPVLSVLQEMGFGLDFLCFGEDPAAFADAVAAIDAVGSVPCTVRVFDSPERLGQALQACESQAIYSEYFFDKRISRSGKAQFSIQDIHMGPAGAVHTLKKLLRVCRLPFYRVYGQYLGEPFGPGTGGAR